MTEPRDEARDVLAAVLHDRKFRGAVSIDSIPDALIAALAARGYRLTPEPAPPVDHQPGDWHVYRAECKVCGQPGQVVLSIEPQRVGTPGV